MGAAAEVEPHIGTLNEGSLHAALKAHYAGPGDRFEVPLGRFVIDIVQPDRLVEIQTGSFAAMGNKFDHLLPEHRILLVYPIPVATYLQRPGKKARKSPRRGSVYSLFNELVSIPTLLDHPHLTLEAVLVTVNRVQVADPTARRGRGGYRTVNTELREIVSSHRFETASDLLELLPEGLPDVFTTADIAELAGIGRNQAQQMAYCLRALGLFVDEGRDRTGYRYSVRRR